jgi:hypothetical protein
MEKCLIMKKIFKKIFLLKENNRENVIEFVFIILLGYFCRARGGTVG